MSQIADPDRRCSKRARTAVATYKEATESDDELLIDDDEIIWRYNDVDFRADKKARPNQENQVFRLMDLATELREMILTVIVSNPDKVVQLEPVPLNNTRLRPWLTEPGVWGTSRARNLYKNLNMMLVSKTIYGETAHIMYSKQRFSFTKLCALQTFLLPMRPETCERLRHVQVKVCAKEWPMMPAIASMMLPCRFLVSFKIQGLCETTSGRDIAKYLEHTGRPLKKWPVTLETFDKINGIKLARDTYPFMYPFFNPIIRAGPPLAGDHDPDSEPSAVAASDSRPVTYEKIVVKVEATPKPEPLAGVGKLLQVVSFDEASRRRVWTQAGFQPRQNVWGWWHGNGNFDRFKDMPMNDTRRAMTIAAMGEELVKLMAKDKY